MNIIVKGAKTLAEYKLKRAAITKLATQLSDHWELGIPVTAWLDSAAVHVVYSDGSRWLLTERDAIRE